LRRLRGKERTPLTNEKGFTKEEQLKAAGISFPTANRYE
jgi:hypothetical protein